MSENEKNKKKRKKNMLINITVNILLLIIIFFLLYFTEGFFDWFMSNFSKSDSIVFIIIGGLFASAVTIFFKKKNMNLKTNIFIWVIISIVIITFYSMYLNEYDFRKVENEVSIQFAKHITGLKEETESKLNSLEYEKIADISKDDTFAYIFKDVLEINKEDKGIEKIINRRNINKAIFVFESNNYEKIIFKNFTESDSILIKKIENLKSEIKVGSINDSIYIYSIKNTILLYYYSLINDSLNAQKYTNINLNIFEGNSYKKVRDDIKTIESFKKDANGRTICITLGKKDNTKSIVSLSYCAENSTNFTLIAENDVLEKIEFSIDTIKTGTYKVDIKTAGYAPESFQINAGLSDSTLKSYKIELDKNN